MSLVKDHQNKHEGGYVLQFKLSYMIYYFPISTLYANKIYVKTKYDLNVTLWYSPKLT